VQSPTLALNQLKSKVLSTTISREYVGEARNRSDSENGLYVSAIQEAVKRYKSFSTFKRNPHYQTILEHVSREHGDRYLEIIKRDSPELLEIIDLFKVNDIVGNPIVFKYPGVGTISPTTLRYVKVASDLAVLFGRDLGKCIVEIGVGYGGQALILDRAFKINRYELLDLPPVLSLVSKYLESHILNCAYKTSTLNQKTGDDSYDLVISNYAFSELPAHLQLKYIEKIISRCKKGYMTMNSGLNKTSRSASKLTIDQLKQNLPPFETLPEDPLSGPENYIIVWGRGDKS
jgi:putative sugar O-methyltransferase